MGTLDYVGWGTSASYMCRHVSSWPGEIALNGRAIHHAGTGDNSAAAEQIRTCTFLVQISVRKMHFPIPLDPQSIKMSTVTRQWLLCVPNNFRFLSGRSEI